MPTRILVVDDDAEIAMLVRQVLCRDGHEVKVATSAQQAMQRFAQQPIDLLITDKNMPEVTGPELIRSLRRLQPGLPVVLMTAFPDLKDETLTIQGYIAKPFARLKTISDVVARTLALARQLDELRRRPSASQTAAA